MNENLNLVEILKDCPKGTKLYSPIYGDVEFLQVLADSKEDYQIDVKLSDNTIDTFTKDGRINSEYNGECLLFPSKEQRDWSKFKVKKSKFDPTTLKPFGKVLGRDEDNEKWNCGFFSHNNEFNNTYPYRCVGTPYTYCIPYNDDTEHLLGTSDKAPEFYRYWED